MSYTEFGFAGRHRHMPSGNSAPWRTPSGAVPLPGAMLTAGLAGGPSGSPPDGTSRPVEGETDTAAVSGARSAQPTDVALGQNVRQLRRSRGMTQKELARAVGVTGAQFHRYETGATRVAASRMIAIAEALGVQPDVLLGAPAAKAATLAPVAATTGDDLVELIRLVSTINDARNRSAVLAVARMLAAPAHPGVS